MRVAVTGAAGRVGHRVVTELAHSGADVVALARRPVQVPEGVALRLADYADPPALAAALRDAEVLVLVTSDGESVRVMGHHHNVLAALGDATGHVVALSSVDADPGSPFCYAVTNALTERAVERTGRDWSVARASIFTDFAADFLRHGAVGADGVLEVALPTGDGRVGFVGRDDIARSLAALALGRPTGRHHELTGPEALDLDGFCRAASTADRGLRFRSVTTTEYVGAHAAVDPWWLYAFTSMFDSVREQRWDRVTGEVEQLTGTPPTAAATLLAGPG